MFLSCQKFFVEGVAASGIKVKWKGQERKGEAYVAQHIEQIKTYPGMEEGMVQKALDDAVKIVKENLREFTDKFQSSNSFDGFYEATENVEWTTGFWTGVIWLAFEHTGDESFRKAAEVQVESFLNRIEQ